MVRKKRHKWESGGDRKELVCMSQGAGGRRQESAGRRKKVPQRPTNKAIWPYFFESASLETRVK